MVAIWYILSQIKLKDVLALYATANVWYLFAALFLIVISYVLSGFRQTPEHVEDIKSVIAWIRTQSGLPVWLVGTSRGTQSAAFVGIALSGAGGPDGLVLTSSILVDPKGRSVNAMPLSELHIPVLVVHHEQDGCKLCPFQETGTLMEQLTNAPRKELLSIKGGDSFGDPCEGRAHHGFNGLDSEVVAQMTAWMLRN